MEKEICFDMDGTICDLYGVDNWLSDLQSSNVRPYKIAKPMCNMNSLAKCLNKLKIKGYKIKIISWTSKSGSETFNTEIAKVKKAWLAKHLKSVMFDEIHVIPYGTPKANYGDGILFDDEQPNRDAWDGIAFDEKNILETLRNLE